MCKFVILFFGIVYNQQYIVSAQCPLQNIRLTDIRNIKVASCTVTFAGENEQK